MLGSARLASLPLRVRLVAGFSVAMLIVLTAAGAFVYWRVQYALDRGLDTELDQASRIIGPLVDNSGQVQEPSAAQATGAGWQVVGADGRVLDHGGPAGSEPMVSGAELHRARDSTVHKDVGGFLLAADQPFRVQVTQLSPPGPGREETFLVVGVRRDHRDEALRELLLQLTLAGLGALLVTAVVGERLAKAALQPVERYRRRARDIAAGATGVRLEVPPGRDDEVTRLGHTLNDMLGELERALEHERRFVNEASHELRTPLTLLRGRVQLARRRTRSVAEHEEVLAELEVDIARLSELAEHLLALGASGNDDEHIDCVACVSGLVERRRLAVPEMVDQLVVELPEAPLLAAVSGVALERVVTNLVDNAFNHGHPPVTLGVSRVVESVASNSDPRLAAAIEWVRIEVADTGAGMDAGLLRSATRRFTRSAEARSRPGAGLGLALVDTIVKQSCGELRLCHGGEHVRHGNVAEVPCDHGPNMTVTVYVPALRA